MADQNLIEIGDDTVVGGDVTLVCHSAERGHLVTAPVSIGRGVTIGLMAVVFPGCTIGDGAMISAGSVLSKGTMVGPGEIWAGVPARRVGRRRPRPPVAAAP
jgi:acetyltransferase-like isoleucine patch superfamily enzyme